MAYISKITPLGSSTTYDIKDSLALRTYNRNDIGISPNFDNPEVNGFFEIRNSTETTGESGTKPFNGYGAFLTMKTPDNISMMQLAGGNTVGWYIRGKQSANVTLNGVAWDRLVTNSGTWDISISGNAATATKATQDASGNIITSTYVKKTGDTMTGTLNIQPASGEGGELHLCASTANTNQAGIILDQLSSTFRIFGIPSADGTTKTGPGTPLVIDPYAKTITGGYTLTGNLSGNADSATKLGSSTVGHSTRGVYLNAGTPTALTWYPNNVGLSSSNTSNYPWHRIATTNLGTGSWVDKDAIIFIRSRYNAGKYGILKISARADNATTTPKGAVTVSATWIVRYGFAENEVRIAKKGLAGESAQCDVYVKCGTYMRALVYLEEGSNNGWTLIASSEVADTTTSDKKTSFEVYTDVSTTIGAITYDTVIDAIDGGNVKYAKTAGSTSGNAATATKLQTARTISLTGAVTGSGSFDGSSDLSIATTVNHTHSYLPLSGGTLTGDLSFKTTSADSPDIIWWYGDTNKEQARIWMGSGGTTKWAPLYRCYKSDGTSLYSGNLVLGDGTGASGTWGISITGSAASCTGNAATADTWKTGRTLTIGYKGQTVNGSADVSWDLHDILYNTNKINATASWDITDPGVYYVSPSGQSAFTGTNNPENANTNNGIAPYRYGQLIVSRASNGGLAQFYISHNDSNSASYGIHFRTGWDSTYLNKWSVLLDSQNYTNWTVTKTGTGASGTWGISITGSAASCTGNAATADTWKTARTLTIGNTGKSVNGSANVSWTKAEILGSGTTSQFYRGDNTWASLTFPYGETLPSTGSTGDIFLQTGAEYYELPVGGATGRLLMKRSTTDRDVQWTNNVYVSNDVLFGAAWNDYAEYRKDNPTEEQEAGKCVYENGDGSLSLTTQRLMRGCEIISDTFGFAIGQDTDNGYNTPIASSGRVLAFPYESIEEFSKHIGWPVCSGPNGTVSIMTEEEEEKYPSRIIGTISEIPKYKEWGTGKVQVNGRIWIRIK